MPQHLVLPGAEARHGMMRGAAGDELDRGIDPSHRLGRLGRETAIFRGALGADLPRPVHLVAEAPELHAMRRVITMLPPQIAQSRPARVIAIFHEIARLRGTPRAEIDRQHGLGPGRSAPSDELVAAEAVGLGRAPGEIETARACIDGPDPVLPIVAGDEIPARIADDRGPELAHQRQHVAPEAALVRRRVARLIDPAIDAAAEMLDEGAEETRIGLADREIPIQDDFRLQHLCPPGRCRASARPLE